MKKIRLTAKKELYNFCEPYVIAEIGSNHNGDMILAKEMILSAKACGADAVKFQSWSPATLIAREEYDRNTKYNDSPKKHFGSLREMCERYYLRPEQHHELKEFCDENDIDFSSSPFANHEVDLLEELNVPFHKVASMDINNLLLLRHIAKTGKPILLSTGMSTLTEIETAVKAIESEGNHNIVLLHCIAIYPPKFEDINMHNITMLQQTFGYPVGFSDHSMGFSIPISSVALGACVIEKHFTIDRDLPGWDHMISADPVEMKMIVEQSKIIAKSMGCFQRIVSADEEAKKLKFLRSVVATRPIAKGSVIVPEDLTAK
ncbi:MAG: N-acetylneuraminate synthase family protein, partial [Lentisphaeria bacterium]|nr:N-acetylneuraminate synthase family protein [Lentisphaeria bacterium]